MGEAKIFISRAKPMMSYALLSALTSRIQVRVKELIRGRVK